MKPFCNLISLFSSLVYSNEYELSFWNEIYGCVNYLNLPYDTVMSLPTYIRKFWIKKHNREATEQSAGVGDGNMSIKSGMDINTYAKIEQKNKELGL